MDGLGELADAPGAAAELAEDVPVLDLSWAFARSPGEWSIPGYPSFLIIERQFILFTGVENRSIPGQLSDDVDAILHQFDEVLEDNAEEFVRSACKRAASDPTRAG